MTPKNDGLRYFQGRPLDDDEIDLFHRDLYNTPVHLERTIGEIGAGQSTIASLVLIHVTTTIDCWQF